MCARRRGTVRADKLVLATNGYTDDVWPGLRRSIVPVYSAIVASEPLPWAPMQSVLYELGRVTVYYRFDRANRLLMGGRSLQRDITEPRELQYLIAYAERLWPEMRDARWSHAWSGQLAITPDHYPHVHEPDESVLVCLGYNGRGVAMSTAMGPQLARRVVGGEHCADRHADHDDEGDAVSRAVAVGGDGTRRVRADTRLAGTLK